MSYLKLPDSMNIAVSTWHEQGEGASDAEPGEAASDALEEVAKHLERGVAKHLEGSVVRGVLGEARSPSPPR